MKRTVQQRIASKKQKIKQRLLAALEQDGEQRVFSASNIHYEIADRTRAISHGGVGVIHLLVNKVELPDLIDAKVKLLKQHRPYHESDHVLNIAQVQALPGPTAVSHCPGPP